MNGPTDVVDVVLDIARDNVAAGGGPFAAVVVRDGQILGTGVNRVTRDLDPTAHGEVVAMRAACRAASDFALRGCVLVSSCEPCPMCLAAALWARVDRVVYVATREDAARAGFDDAEFYQELAREPGERRMAVARVAHPRVWEPFAAWLDFPGRVPY